jgi:hypothetical protein
VAWSSLLIGSAPAGHGAPRNDILLSAASPFEDLTEYALSGNKPGMHQALKAYADQAAAVRAVMAAQPSREMDSLIAAIKKAESRGDHETVALKSVEVYRILIESLDAKRLAVPVQVSLLDYAGFKFQALLHAKSTDWLALGHVAKEAQQNWAAIRSRVTDQGLSDAVDTAVAGMDKACMAKNGEMASFAAEIDLTLVDLLEGYFTRSSR